MHLDPASRDRLVCEHLPLVTALARRYAGRGEALDDLVQVGCVALIHAVDRFDPTREVPLEAYATATIGGEIRRHLRDRPRPVRVPRGRASEALPPVQLPEDLAGTPDALAAADDRADLKAAVRHLQERERLALGLRYMADLPRAEVARHLGLSEVQTSRVVSEALRKCAEALADRPRST